MRSRFRSPIAFVPLGALVVLAVACPSPHVEPPAPQPNVDAPSPPGPSTINVQITAPLSAVKALVEDSIPSSMGAPNYNVQVDGGAENVGHGVSFGYHLERDHFQLAAYGNTITIATNIRYAVDAIARGTAPKTPIVILTPWAIPALALHPIVHGSCGIGEPLRTASIKIITSLRVDSSWHLVSHTVPVAVTPTSRCTVTFLNKDVTDVVMGGMRAALVKLSGQLDQKIAGAVPLPAIAGKAWQTLSNPIALGPNAWLVVHPTAAGLTGLQGNGQTVTVGAMFVARPVVAFGPKPTTSATSLPPQTAAPGGNNFVINLPVLADAAALSNAARQALKIGQGGIRYPPTGKRYIRPTAIDVYAYGRQAVVRVPFEGSAKGILYFVGTPHFDAGSNILSFPDLDYSLETRNLIAKVLNWWEHDALRNDLRQRLTINLSQPIDTAKSQLTAALNRQVGPVHLTGKVAHLHLIDVYANPDSGRFEAIWSADGTVKGTVHP